jgi:hypothetical protein
MVIVVDKTEIRKREREKAQKVKGLVDRFFTNCVINESVGTIFVGLPPPHGTGNIDTIATIESGGNYMTLKNPSYFEIAQNFGKEYEKQIFGVEPDKSSGLLRLLSRKKEHPQFTIRTDYS